MVSILSYLILLNAPSDVEKVCRISSVVLDDVHGGHSEAGAIHQAADVAVHLYVAQVEAGRLNLPAGRTRLDKM
jgi:hypothetical protein